MPLLSPMLRHECLLLVAAAIWGFAFVAQRSGMEHVGPFTFNGIRFLMGALALIPIYYAIAYKGKTQTKHRPIVKLRQTITIGFLLFIAASLQQTGLVYTTAGNAGFITGLYVVFVPIIGLFLQQKTQAITWLGIALAFIGLSLLSAHSSHELRYGDFLQLIGAVFWALHIIAIGKYAPDNDPIVLCIIQFGLCGLMSLVVGVITEAITYSALIEVLPALLYTGILSTAIAFTLQVFAQKKVPASHAAVIFSLESVFALLGGWLILDEHMHTLGLVGCALIFAGVLISQQGHQNHSV